MNRALSIRRKVTLITVITSITVLVLSLAAFVLFHLVTFHQTTMANLSDTASIVAYSTAGALLTHDRSQAERALLALAANPSVVCAALYDTNGFMLARYPANRRISDFPLVPGKTGHWSERDRLRLFKAVRAGNHRAGTLFLEADKAPMYQQLRLAIAIFLVLLCAAVGVATLVGQRLQHRITRPILALKDVASVITERKDYSIRAPKFHTDEVGELTDAFNNMLTMLESQSHEARQYEEMRSFLVATLASSDDAIIAKDLNSRVVSWNAGAVRMFGFTEAEMVGQSVTRILSRPEEEAQIIEAARRGQIRHYETFRVRKDGTPIHVALTISPIRNVAGKIIGVSSIARDITERKRAEDELRRLASELEQRVEQRTAELREANRELEGFTYSVAHDLRGPLRHMDAFSKILLEDFASYLPPEARLYLESVRHGSQNMSRLVDDLLNLARIGRQQLRRKPASLDQLVAEVIADLQSECRDRVIEWRRGCLPEVECDPGLMKVVLANLLSNALKYSRPRSPAIIEIGTTPHDGGNAIFVRDNGVGFNMKYYRRLFGVFQRLHRVDEFEGTGIGLATVERILRKHGGSVWAEAVVGQGATFYFTLPDLCPLAEQPVTLNA